MFAVGCQFLPEPVVANEPLDRHCQRPRVTLGNEEPVMGVTG